MSPWARVAWCAFACGQVCLFWGNTRAGVSLCLVAAGGLLGVHLYGFFRGDGSR